MGNGIGSTEKCRNNNPDRACHVPARGYKLLCAQEPRELPSMRGRAVLQLSAEAIAYATKVRENSL